MRTSKPFASLFLLSVAAGCANHPLPDEVTGYSTFDIIHKVRCEAQQTTRYYYDFMRFGPQIEKLKGYDKNLKELGDAVEAERPSYEKLKNRIENLEYDLDQGQKKSEALKRRKSALKKEFDALAKEYPDPTKPVPPDVLEQMMRLVNETAAVNAASKRNEFELAALEEERSPLAKEEKKHPYKTSWKQFSGQTAARGEQFASLIKFQGTIMAYQFLFEITEDNNATLVGSFKWPIHLGTFTFGYDVGDKKKRFAKRVVKLATTFAELNDKVECRDVDLQLSQRAERYLVMGNIGMAEVVAQYLRIADKANFEKGENETFTDRIKFTTRFNAGAKPSLELTTPAKVVIKADADLHAIREDIHEVIVEIAPPAEETAKPKTGGAS